MLSLTVSSASSKRQGEEDQHVGANIAAKAGEGLAQGDLILDPELRADYSEDITGGEAMAPACSSMTANDRIEYGVPNVHHLQGRMTAFGTSRGSEGVRLMSVCILASSITAGLGTVEKWRVFYGPQKNGQSISALPVASDVNLFGNFECVINLGLVPQKCRIPISFTQLPFQTRAGFYRLV